jgi:hypothetical protein
MNAETAKFETVCSQSDIAAYLDGELDAPSVLLLELHLTDCGNCFNSLREQKMVLCALNAVLDNKDQIELPVNFAKKVTVRAESGLSGLRKREERWTAVKICVLLFGLAGAIGLGGGSFYAGAAIDSSLRVISSVGGFIWSLLYDISLGAIVIIRTLMRFLVSDPNLYAFAIFSILLLSLILCSSFYLRIRRLKF